MLKRDWNAESALWCRDATS